MGSARCVVGCLETNTDTDTETYSTFWHSFFHFLALFVLLLWRYGWPGFLPKLVYGADFSTPDRGSVNTPTWALWLGSVGLILVFLYFYGL